MVSFLVASAVLVDDESLLIFEMDVDPKMLRAVLAPLIGALSLLRPPVMKGCLVALVGFSLLSGSQIRHLAIKSTKSASSHRNTWLNVLVPGRLRRPLEFTTGRGAPEESKKILRRELRWIISLSGIPKTSIIQASCSCSFSPGKIGKPV